MGSDRFRRAVIAFAFVMSLAMVAVMTVAYVYSARFGNDFGVYWRTANNPLELVYAPMWRFPFPYAPTMLLWITPLGFVPKWLAYVLFCLGSGWALYLAVKPYLS